jgi:hypothetical protein
MMGTHGVRPSRSFPCSTQPCIHHLHQPTSPPPANTHPTRLQYSPDPCGLSPHPHPKHPFPFRFPHSPGRSSPTHLTPSHHIHGHIHGRHKLPPWPPHSTALAPSLYCTGPLTLLHWPPHSTALAPSLYCTGPATPLPPGCTLPILSTRHTQGHSHVTVDTPAPSHLGVVHGERKLHRRLILLLALPLPQLPPKLQAQLGGGPRGRRRRGRPPPGSPPPPPPPPPPPRGGGARGGGGGAPPPPPLPPPPAQQ